MNLLKSYIYDDAAVMQAQQEAQRAGASLPQWSEVLRLDVPVFDILVRAVSYILPCRI